MSRTECIIFAFRAFRETAYAVLHPVLAEGFAAPGDDLVGVGLMADIEHQLVGRSVIYIMETDNQFHSSEAGTKVPGIDRAAFYHIAADLVAEGP